MTTTSTFSIPITLVAIDTEHGSVNPTSAQLSTERAESSHGLPVVVVDGVALGTAEVGEGSYLEIDDVEIEPSDEEVEAYWAPKGGWRLDVLDPGPASTFVSREREREAARLAGYRVTGCVRGGA